MLGTPAYMAPEQIDSRLGPVGPAVDVYALGAILYELLTGRPPHQGPQPTDVLLRVVGDEPTPPGRLNRRVSPDLEAVCMRCLRKQPGERYPSAAALADDLGRFLDGRPVLTRRPTVWARGRGWFRSDRGRAWLRRRPRIAIVLAAVLLAVFLLRGRGKDTAGSRAPRADGERRTVKVPGGEIPVPPVAPEILEGIPFSGAFQVQVLDVHAFRGDPPRPLGQIGHGVRVLRADDAIQAHVFFSKRAYCYLVAFGPDGKDRLCFPAGEDAEPEAVNHFFFPGTTEGAELQGGAGLHALILVTSHDPLPSYVKWKERLGPLPWKGVQADGVWSFGGRHFVPLDRDRGAAEKKPPEPFEKLCRLLASRPGVDHVRAIAFPVRESDED